MSSPRRGNTILIEMVNNVQFRMILISEENNFIYVPISYWFRHALPGQCLRSLGDIVQVGKDDIN